MSRKSVSPLPTRSPFVGRPAAPREHAVLRADAAILTAIVVGCTLVAWAALFSNADLWRAASLGAFVAVQTTVFAFDGAPHIAIAVLVTAYVALSLERWDATFALSLLCVAIAIANNARHAQQI